MTIDEHAEAILRAADYLRLTNCRPEDRPAILAAVRAVYEAGRVDGAGVMREAARMTATERNLFCALDILALDPAQVVAAHTAGDGE